MKFILNGLIKALVKWCQKHGRVYHITGGTPDDVYMVRYIVLKSRLCCIYIHRFMRSDSDDPHDHPWNFITYIAEGGYSEDFYDVNQPSKTDKKYLAYWTKRVNVRVPGSFAFRRATDIHRVVLKRNYKMAEIKKAPLTACIMFKRQRHWGFWPLLHKGSLFVDWRKYLKISPRDVRIEGSE